MPSKPRGTSRAPSKAAAAKVSSKVTANKKSLSPMKPAKSPAKPKAATSRTRVTKANAKKIENVDEDDGDDGDEVQEPTQKSSRGRADKKSAPKVSKKKAAATVDDSGDEEEEGEEKQKKTRKASKSASKSTKPKATSKTRKSLTTPSTSPTPQKRTKTTTTTTDESEVVSLKKQQPTTPSHSPTAKLPQTPKTPKSKTIPVLPPPTPQTPPSTQSLAVFSVIFYFITSIGTVLLNKHLLDGELKKSTAFITWVQIVFSVLVTYSMSFISNLFSTKNSSDVIVAPKSDDNKNSFSTSIYPFIKTLPASVIFCAMLILNNLCLRYVHITFYQVARSWTILMSIILSYYFFGDKASTKQLICCTIIVIGYLSACEGELPWSELWTEFESLIVRLGLNFKFYFTPSSLTQLEVDKLTSFISSASTETNSSNGSILLGLIFGFLSCFMVAYNAILSKQLQRSTTLTRSELIGAVNLNSSIILFVYLVLSGELAQTLENPALYQTKNILPLLLVSLCGHMLGFATQMQIQFTSALGHNVSGTAKASVQSIIAWYIEPKPISTLTIIGTAVTIIACGCYAVIDGPKPTPLPTPPTTTTTSSVSLPTLSKRAQSKTRG